MRCVNQWITKCVSGCMADLMYGCYEGKNQNTKQMCQTKAAAGWIFCSCSPICSSADYCLQNRGGFVFALLTGQGPSQHGRESQLCSSQAWTGKEILMAGAQISIGIKQFSIIIYWSLVVLCRPLEWHPSWHRYTNMVTHKLK